MFAVSRFTNQELYFTLLADHANERLLFPDQMELLSSERIWFVWIPGYFSPPLEIMKIVRSEICVHCSRHHTFMTLKDSFREGRKSVSKQQYGFRGMGFHENCDCLEGCR